MIITKQKPKAEILDSLGKAKKIFLTGCSLCATVCKTGGEDQLKDFIDILKQEKKTVTGWSVLEQACNFLEVKRLYRQKKEEMDGADAILSFSCGSGLQTLSGLLKGKMVLPGNDTLFQGEIAELSLKKAQFDQKCSLCGECMLATTGGICPVTRCAKGLVNGPCGGVKNGKCEIDSDLDCAWLVIYERLKELGSLSSIKKRRPPKDNSKSKKPQKHIIK